MKSFILARAFGPDTDSTTLTQTTLAKIAAEQWESILSELEALTPEQCAEMVIFYCVS